MKKILLRYPVRALDPEKISTVSELVEAFNHTSFQSRTLAKCATIFQAMLEDHDRVTIFLGLSGAMVPAGMKTVVSTMIRRGMVDTIVSTGANMYHDTVEALGEPHYIGVPDADDAVLAEQGIDRIFDTYADEKEYRRIDNLIMYFADSIADDSTPPISSRSFMERLGRFIDAKSPMEYKENSIVWNGWRYDVPIFIPALSDSSLGLALTQHYIKYVDSGRKPLIIDEIRDNYEILQIKKAARKTGVVFVGGGVPKNYIQQTAYLQDMFGIPDAGHDYGIQITTDSPQWGGLSGATFKEGVSWGKEKTGGTYMACYCDATIAFPIIVKAAIERVGSLPNRQRLAFTF